MRSIIYTEEDVQKDAKRRSEMTNLKRAVRTIRALKFNENADGIAKAYNPKADALPTASTLNVCLATLLRHAEKTTGKVF